MFVQFIKKLLRNEKQRNIKIRSHKESSDPKPDAAVHEEAKKYPNGWVYSIYGGYGPNDAVPPEAIIGAWKVDSHGKLTGDFEKNPRFDPSHLKNESGMN